MLLLLEQGSVLFVVFFFFCSAFGKIKILKSSQEARYGIGGTVSEDGLVSKHLTLNFFLAGESWKVCGPGGPGTCCLADTLKACSLSISSCVSARVGVLAGEPDS